MEKIKTTTKRTPLYLKLRIFFLSPLWFFSTSPTRKTWEEFKGGLEKHICTFNYLNPIYEKGWPYYKCEHFGCNIVTIRCKDTKIILDDPKENKFTNEELLTIQTDILHIYKSISLDVLEVHKRNLILNKIEVLLKDT